jgi:hypothetical protein
MFHLDPAAVTALALFVGALAELVWSLRRKR